MPDSSSEADARIIIDDALRQAGWEPTDKSQVATEVAMPAAAVGDTSVDTAKWELTESPGSPRALSRADYVLLDEQGRPLAVIEAKRRAIEPYTAKTQTLPYAQRLGAPFIFLTNGEVLYFWDHEQGDARIVTSFFSQRDLIRLRDMRKVRVPLATIEIPRYYQRQGETRELRDYQQNCLRAMDRAFELSKRRFLAELPTGTGKTDIICQQIKRLIDSGHVERVLFLVDRDQLAKQALEALQELLPTHSSYWLKPGAMRQEKQITVALLQTMIGRHRDYTSGYFDLVVMDECHRSIYGAWQLALTHFDALHVGLTATPAAYIDRNTFRFYQCTGDQPDFSYRIQDALQAGHLAPYKFAKGITRIMAEGAQKDGEDYDPVAFERKWTNEDTNRKMMEEFDRLAWQTYREQAPRQKVGPGKSLVFAITKNHAARLAHYLNALHPEHKGNYAAVITSDVADADDLIRRFKRETYPMIAITVGMLDTGFDCREILHVVLARRVRSPILYQQIRGRGTRTAHHIEKRHFVIYDFFGNHEYFNDSETDIFSGGAYGGGGTRPSHAPTPRELVELGLQDEWLYKTTYVEVGPAGERVDKRDYVTDWEKSVKSAADTDPIIHKVRTDQPLTDEEIATLSQRLNQPSRYFNEENLRRAYSRPGGQLIDFIREALGLVKHRSHEETLDDNFRAWLVTRALSPDQAAYLHLLKNRGIARGRIEVGDLFKPPLSALNAAARGLELFGESGLKTIIQDINEAVFTDDRRSA